MAVWRYWNAPVRYAAVLCAARARVLVCLCVCVRACVCALRSMRASLNPYVGLPLLSTLL